MIQLRVVSPPDITDVLVPLLRSEPAVMNLTVLRSAVSCPDGDAVQFDVLQGAVDEVIGRIRHLGVEQRGSIVLQNIDVSLAFGSGTEAWGSTLQLLLNVTVLTAVAMAGLPAQKAIWRRRARGRATLGG